MFEFWSGSSSAEGRLAALLDAVPGGLRSIVLEIDLPVRSDACCEHVHREPDEGGAAAQVEVAGESDVAGAEETAESARPLLEAGLVGLRELPVGPDLAALVWTTHERLSTGEALPDAVLVDLQTAAARLGAAFDGLSAVARVEHADRAVSRAVEAERREREARRSAGLVVLGSDREALHDAEVGALDDVARQVSLALGITPFAAGRLLDSQRSLADRLPHVVADVVAGRLPLDKALVVADRLPTPRSIQPGAPDLAVEIGERLRGRGRRPLRELVDPDGSVRIGGNVPHTSPLWDLTRRRLSEAVDRELCQLDRDAAKKAKEARKRCGVRAHASPDATGQVVADVELEVALAVDAVYAADASAAKAAGDERSLDALKAAFFAYRNTNGAFGDLPPSCVPANSGPVLSADPVASAGAGHPGEDGDAAAVGLVAVDGTAVGDTSTCVPTCRKPHETVLVQITVAAETLAGLDDEPATVSGHPVPGGTARDLVKAALAGTFAPGATVLVERLLTCPVSGVLTDISRRYTASPRQRRFCLARDGESRFPTSGAALAELDHVRRWRGVLPDGTARGGATTTGNLESLGIRDHRARHRPGWDVAGDANGVLTWTTPTGHAYASRPRALTQPRTTAASSPGDDGDPPF